MNPATARSTPDQPAQELPIRNGGTADHFAVQKLTLSDFRCYRSLRLSLDDRPVVLTGPNGAGKTNLLEAVSFLAPGRGLRRAQLGEVTRRNSGGNGWATAATLSTPSGPVDVGTGLVPDPNKQSPADKRSIRIDGLQARGQGALAEAVTVTWLTPEMDRVFLDAASGRRRFLDRIIYGFDPAHSGRVAAYETAMRQRLRLLREGRGEPAWLSALETTMAEKGVAIAAARRHVVERLDEVCAMTLEPFPRAGLRLDGMVEDLLARGPALAAEERLLETLESNRRADADAGRTLAGPHRTDLRVRYLAKDLPAETVSTGEQKALLIAIVLATARLQAAHRGAAPLLLMDEVVAHLDKARRGALFAELQALGAQAWLTGTEEALFTDLGAAAQVFAVTGGRLTPRGG